MMKNFVYILLGIASIFLTACVDEIAFENTELRSFLVINGSITDQAGPYQITVRESGTATAGETPISGASVYILDGRALRTDFREISPGIYESDSSQLQGVVGESYQLRVELPNGENYESRMEKLPAPLPIQELSFRYSEEEILNELSNIVLAKRLRIFVQNQIPPGRNELYVKWDTYGEWEFRETDALSDIFATSGAGPEMFTCFIKDPLNLGDLHIFDGKGLANISFRQEIKMIPVDYKFAFNYCVHVNQLVINRGAYEFFEQMKKLGERNGLFLESQAGTIRGNISNATEASELVMGYFYTASINKDLIFVSPDEVSKPLSKCLNIDPEFVEACDECLLLRGAFRGAPDYWP